MTVIYKPFKTIEEIKKRGEFIPKGRIYPVRILKSNSKKEQVYARSGSNQWAIPTPSGYLIFVENNDGYFESVIRIWVLSPKGYRGSPYSGSTTWQGNGQGLDYFESLSLFNDRYISMCIPK